MKFSYDRASNCRREYLKELLISVYGTTNIKYEYDTNYECVSHGNSIFSLCKFETRKSMGHFCERFKELFEYALLNGNFEFKPPRGKDTTIGPDSVIKNTQNYFNKIGVDFSAYSGMEVNKEKWRWVLYKAMILYLLPAIFFVEYKDRYEENHVDDDIHLQIQAAVMGIQKLIDAELFFFISDSTITKVYDSRFNNNEFNYMLPIEIASLNPPTIICWKDISVGIICNNENTINVAKQEQPENILDGFIKTNPQEEKMMTIKCPSINKAVYTVPISNMSYGSQKILTNDFQYYTHIDDDDKKIREEYNSNAHLKRVIRANAKNDILKLFLTEEPNYYLSIIKNIESAISNISKIDVQLFTKDNINISEYQRALGYFTQEANEIVTAYTKGFGEESCKNKIKSTVIELISRFYDQLESKGKQLAEKYDAVLKTEVIANHKECIGKYLQKAKFTTISEAYKKIRPELTTFEKLNEIVQNYYNLL